MLNQITWLMDLFKPQLMANIVLTISLLNLSQTLWPKEVSFKHTNANLVQPAYFSTWVVDHNKT